MHIKTQNWKERFDKKFSSEWWNGFGTTDDINKGGIESIKSFITSLLEERDKELQQIDSLKTTTLSCGCEVMKVTLCDKHARFIKLEEKK